MLKVAKETPPGSRVSSARGFRVLVHQDGHLELAPPTFAPKRVHVSGIATSASIAAEVNSASEEALIAANRAKLAKLRAQPYSTVPDFPDALRASVTRSAPKIGFALAAFALLKTGMLSDPAVFGGLSLRYVVTWLGDRGYRPTASERAELPPSLFYENPQGLVAWIMLDWIHRSLAAAEISDEELEDELDAYYPRWSRTDFEWDIKRLGEGPLLNAYPDWYASTDDVPPAVPTDAADPPRPRRRVHTAGATRREFTRTFGATANQTPYLDHRDRRNHAHDRRRHTVRRRL